MATSLSMHCASDLQNPGDQPRMRNLRLQPGMQGLSDTISGRQARPHRADGAVVQDNGRAAAQPLQLCRVGAVVDGPPVALRAPGILRRRRRTRASRRLVAVLVLICDSKITILMSP